MHHQTGSRAGILGAHHQTGFRAGILGVHHQTGFTAGIVGVHHQAGFVQCWNCRCAPSDWVCALLDSGFRAL